MIVSVIISARDEFPNIIHTIHSIVNDLETFLRPDQFEIIIVDNGSIDTDSWRYIMERGMYRHRTVRVLRDPLMGNVTSRNKGVDIAKGEYIFFSDAHMSYKIGSFKRMIQTIDETGGMVHPAVQWMGGYEPSLPSLQYTIKLGEKIWGTWTHNQVVADHWFYIPISGHCCLGMKRAQFIEFGGYNNWFRCYGGGEVYLDMKWWMLGSTVVVEPRALVYHLSAGRGYAFHQDDLIHNMMLLGYALNADAFGERVYIRYLDKGRLNISRLNDLHEQAKNEARSDQQFLQERNAQSFYDIVASRPWDIKNMEKFGTKNSALAVYDETWIRNLNPTAQSFYDSSPIQKELRTFIDSRLKQYIYRGKA